MGSADAALIAQAALRYRKDYSVMVVFCAQAQEAQRLLEEIPTFAPQLKTRLLPDWEKYYSSNEWIKSEVKEGRADDFEREIIQFCFSKKSLSYYEIKWQFHYDVLANEQAINENLMGKFFRRDIINQ